MNSQSANKLKLPRTITNYVDQFDLHNLYNTITVKNPFKSPLYNLRFRFQSNNNYSMRLVTCMLSYSERFC